MGRTLNHALEHAEEKRLAQSASEGLMHDSTFDVVLLADEIYRLRALRGEHSLVDCVARVQNAMRLEKEWDERHGPVPTTQP